MVSMEGVPSKSVIRSSWCTTFLPGNSGFPVSTSAKMHPILHMSIAGVYCNYTQKKKGRMKNEGNTKGNYQFSLLKQQYFSIIFQLFRNNVPWKRMSHKALELYTTGSQHNPALIIVIQVA